MRIKEIINGVLPQMTRKKLGMIFWLGVYITFVFLVSFRSIHNSYFLLSKIMIFSRLHE